MIQGYWAEIPQYRLRSKQKAAIKISNCFKALEESGVPQPEGIHPQLNQLWKQQMRLMIQRSYLQETNLYMPVRNPNASG